MELTQIRESTVRKVTVEATDGIVVGSAHGKDMQVSSAILVYSINGDQWVVDQVVVTGRRIKEDGSVGKRNDTVSFGWIDNAPVWVQKMAEHYRPKDPAPGDPVPTCVLDIE